MTFQYWRGGMNWPIDHNWQCEICGNFSLTWGILHARCRCNECHVQYHMRNENDDIVTTPICMLKPEYYLPVKQIWLECQVPIDEWSDWRLKKMHQLSEMNKGE